MCCKGDQADLLLSSLQKISIRTSKKIPLSATEKIRYQGQQLMEFSKLMFHQRPKFCRFIKIPKEAHHRQLSDFLLSSFYAPKFSKTRQILRPTFKTTHSRVVNESRIASTK